MAYNQSDALKCVLQIIHWPRPNSLKVATTDFSMSKNIEMSVVDIWSLGQSRSIA